MSDSVVREALPSPPVWLRSRQEPVARMAEAAPHASRPRPVQESEERGTSLGQKDWSFALDLVRETSEVVRMSEERVLELEIEIQELSAKASEGLRHLQAELQAGERRWAGSEERARLAEARAKEAEARAKDAEMWLDRLGEAIIGSFARAANSDKTAEHL